MKTLIRFFNTYEVVTTFFRDLMPHLARKGFDVEAVISRASYRPDRDLKGALSGMSHTSIVEVPSWGLQPDTKVRKAGVMASYVLGASLRTLRPRKNTINVFLTQPPLFPVWGYVLRRMLGQPYVCVVMDIYPDLMVEYGMLKAGAVSTRAMAVMASWALRHAEGVVSIGRCMTERLVTMGVDPNRIRLIPNWIDEEQVKCLRTDECALRKQWGLHDKFVIQYSGNMGLSHYFDDLLAAAEDLKREENIAFVLVGGGTRRAEIGRHVAEHDLQNVHLFPFQPPHMLGDSLAVGDIHFLSLRNGCTGLAVPSKSYGVLAAGRPIVYQGDAQGEIAQMIAEEDVGTVLPCGDVDALRAAILRYTNQDLRRRQGEKARALSEGSYSRERALDAYAALLHAVSETVTQERRT